MYWRLIKKKKKVTNAEIPGLFKYKIAIDNYSAFCCVYGKLSCELKINNKIEHVKSGCLKLDTDDILRYLVNSWLLRNPKYRVLTEVILTLYIMFIHKASNLFVFLNTDLCI